MDHKTFEHKLLTALYDEIESRGIELPESPDVLVSPVGTWIIDGETGKSIVRINLTIE